MSGWRLFVFTVASVVRALGASWEEDFSIDPQLHGWRAFGETAQFRWDSAGQQLLVTWDSSKPNSYFYHALGTVLAKTDDVRVSFDLQIDELNVGTTRGKPFAFELAIGLINLHDATSTNFIRGTAVQSPNLLEFDYFADSGFGATVSPIIVSSNNLFVPSFTFPLELTIGERFHIELAYTAATQTLATTLLRAGQPIADIKEVKLGPAFTDFRLNTFAVAGYSDQGAGGSLHARGRIDNISVLVPDPPVTRLQLVWSGNSWRARFIGHPAWTYTLERSTGWDHWDQASAPVQGSGGSQTSLDELPGPTPDHAFYRMRLERP
jgi:hypothetical protein